MDSILKQAMSSASQAAQNAQQAQKDQDNQDKAVDAKQDEKQDLGNVSQPVRAAKAKLDEAYSKGNKHHKASWKADKAYMEAEHEYRQAKAKASHIRRVETTISQGDDRSESNRTNVQANWQARANQTNNQDTTTDDSSFNNDEQAQPNKDSNQDEQRKFSSAKAGMGKSAKLAGGSEDTRSFRAAGTGAGEGEDAYTGAKDKAPRAMYSAGSPAERASDLPEQGEPQHDLLETDSDEGGRNSSKEQKPGSDKAVKGAEYTQAAGDRSGRSNGPQIGGKHENEASSKSSTAGHQLSSTKAPASASSSSHAAGPAVGAGPVHYHVDAKYAGSQRPAAVGNGKASAPAAVGGGKTQLKEGGSVSSQSGLFDSAEPSASGQYGSSNTGRGQAGSGSLGGKNGGGEQQGSFNLPVAATGTGQGKSLGGPGVSKADVESSPMVSNSGSVLSASQESNVRSAAGRYFAGLREADKHEQFTEKFIKDLVDNFDKNKQDDEGHYKNTGKGGKGAKGAKGAKAVATTGGVAGPSGAAGTGAAKTALVEDGTAGLTAGGAPGGSAGKSAIATGSGKISNGSKKTAASTGASDDTGTDVSANDNTPVPVQNGGSTGMTAMEFVQLVMMQAFREAGKDAESMAKTLQAQTAQKAIFRGQQAGLQAQVTYDNQNITDSGKAAQNQLDNLEAATDAIGDDNQLAFIRLQNLTQLMTTMSQAASNVSKNLYDVEKSTIGNIGH